MSGWELLFVATLSALFVLLLTLDEPKPGLAPDSLYYLALAAGNRVPVPFCFRPAVPGVLGVGQRNWRLATVAALVLQGVFVSIYAHDWRAAVLLLALPGGARFSVRHPVLVDAVAMAVTLGAACFLPANPPLLVVAGVALAMVRETCPLWLAVYLMSPWPLFGFLVLPGHYAWFSRDATASDPIFVSQPWVCLRKRAGHWLNVHLMVVPWGVVLPLALLGDWKLAVGAYALSCAPLAIVTDTARVQVWAAPLLVVAALNAPIPAAAWPLLLGVHLFNPYRGA